MTLTKRQQQAQDTRKKLMHAAVEIIRADGYPALTIRKLCTKAKVSTGAFYHYFSKKDDIIDEAFKEYDKRLGEQIHSYENEDPVHAVKTLVLSLTEHVYHTAHTSTKEVYIYQLYSDDPYIVKQDREYIHIIKFYVEKAIDQGLFTDEYSSGYITDYLIRTNRGVIIDWCFHGYSYDLLQQAKADIDMAVKGLMTNKGQAH